MKLDSRITDKNCLWDLHELKIPKHVANDYLQQAEIDKKKCLAFENNNGGFVVRMPLERDWRVDEFQVNPEGITTFAAHPEEEKVTVYLFDHFLDFLAYISAYGRMRNGCYVISNGRIIEALTHIEEQNPEIVLHSYRKQEDCDFAAFFLDGSNINYGTTEHLHEGYRNLSEFMRKSPNAYKLNSQVKHTSGPVPKPKI